SMRDRTSFVGPLVAGVLALVAARAGAAEDPRPNLVWIVGEDMGPELGGYGDPNADTPHMARLAREGARLRRALPHGPVRAARRPSAVGALVGVVLGLVAARAGAAEEPRPNLVWIVGEDMGPELGCYGDPNADTPNMDRLAREGARFTRAFTHAPVCAPSRS